MGLACVSSQLPPAPPAPGLVVTLSTEQVLLDLDAAFQVTHLGFAYCSRRNGLHEFVLDGGISFPSIS